MGISIIIEEMNTYNDVISNSRYSTITSDIEIDPEPQFVPLMKMMKTIAGKQLFKYIIVSSRNCPWIRTSKFYLISDGEKGR